MGEMADMYDYYDDGILDYEQCEFCGKYLPEDEVELHRCLNDNLMRQIVDERIKWLMKRKQEKHGASNAISSN